MASKFRRKLAKSFKRSLRSRAFAVSVVATVLVASTIAYNGYMQNRRLTVDPSSYERLLGLIASVESKNNYNAYFGNAANSSIDFTAMTVADVMHWQAEHVAQGNASNAVGRYQIISGTLSGLVSRLNIDPSAKFDQPLQDRMAIALLERRGAERYVNKELTQEEFAANLAKEWAALPSVTGADPQASYYAGDGLNKSLVSVDKVLSAIEPIRAQE